MAPRFHGSPGRQHLGAHPESPACVQQSGGPCSHLPSRAMTRGLGLGLGPAPPDHACGLSSTGGHSFSELRAWEQVSRRLAEPPQAATRRLRKAPGVGLDTGLCRAFLMPHIFSLHPTCLTYSLFQTRAGESNIFSTKVEGTRSCSKDPLPWKLHFLKSCRVFLLKTQGFNLTRPSVQLSELRSSLVAQRVKDQALSVQQLRVLLWCRFDP